MESIKKLIRTIPDFPKKGIMFRDITTLLQDPQGLRLVTEAFLGRYADSNIDVVSGIEARGFILGGILAEKLGVGFVPIRKKGKLPFTTESQEYDLEYGTDTVEMHTDSISEGQNVLVVDDLIATGGTALAACTLVQKLGGRVEECCFIVDLPDLGGSARLHESGFIPYALVDFDGE